ncbi:HAMP domain-containing sensor histidine kinase [Miniphocaeibacter halophilus]|uniref:HAMP domain-containing histidine kinase n=1 Tax=Miniphocaeibacter halophilus TaxID=2931922 RepID=A0AC61MRB8_9FIRM|nr:HAMP domain-containing sensor histidine kinase [Miniphocaeibacter halophilus]QQK06976.1 HAMP domain-containing histidine kinase [Miniphocaeibacter halophilus]
MTRKKSIFKELIASFVVFSLSIVLILVISGALVIFNIIENEDNYIPTNMINDKGEIQSRFLIDNYNAWVEQLDSNNKVVSVVGNKLDKTMNYSDRDIMELLNLKDNSEEFHVFIKFLGEEKYLIKIPTKNLALTLNLTNSRSKNSKVFGILFLAFYIFMIILLSKRLSNKIKKPIDKMLFAMDRVKDGEKGVQIDFQTKNELNELKDNFNDMIIKLEREEEYRIKKEEEKNKLLLDLSHDIKTPISTIKSYSLALKDDLVKEEDKKDYYDILDKKASRISYLVDEMTNMLKLDNKDYKLYMEKANFSEVVRQTVSEYYNELENKKIDVEVNLPKDDIYINIDLNLIKRVLNNLMENQLKYNSGTFTRISLEEENNKLILEISDNGKLIDKNTRKTLFNPFVRGDKARSTSGGLGLGLSISKTIINKHKGEIYYSNKGNLNNFVVELNIK